MEGSQVIQSHSRTPLDPKTSISPSEEGKDNNGKRKPALKRSRAVNYDEDEDNKGGDQDGEVKESQ